MKYKTYLVSFNQRKQKRMEESTKLFTQEEVTKLINKEIWAWKDAVWQYMTDHTTPSRRGFTIRFFVQRQSNFWWRVECRKNGTFSRSDTQRIANQVEQTIYGENRQAFIESRLQTFKKSGSLKVRLFLKIRNYLGAKLEALAKSGPEWEEFKKNPVYFKTVKPH